MAVFRDSIRFLFGGAADFSDWCRARVSYCRRFLAGCVDARSARVDRVLHRAERADLARRRARHHDFFDLATDF